MLNPYNATTDVVLKQLQTDAVKGLSTEEVTKREQEYGENKLRELHGLTASDARVENEED